MTKESFKFLCNESCYLLLERKPFFRHRFGNEHRMAHAVNFLQGAVEEENVLEVKVFSAGRQVGLKIVPLSVSVVQKTQISFGIRSS